MCEVEKLKLERYGLVNIVRRNEFREETGHYLKRKDFHALRLSGLPKIHKDCAPLKRIVSKLCSCTIRKYIKISYSNFREEVFYLKEPVAGEKFL